VSKVNKFTCSDPGQKIIKNDIQELDLKRVVVASWTPKIHEPTYKSLCAESGLNPNYFQMVNIREHCSFVHQDNKEKATQKAKNLIRAGVNRARLLETVPIKELSVEKSALVIGAGIAGMNAALNLANHGIKVYLVEKEPTIGGRMAQLDRIFPTDDCGIWVLAPIMVNASKHPNIELMTYCEVVEFGGFAGNYEIKILKKPRYVDENKCTGCGLCTTKCPIDVPDEFNRGIGQRHAIYIPFPQAVPILALIDKEVCIDCKLCEKDCPAEAIDYEQQPEYIDIKVGAVIIATGWDEYPIIDSNEYGYGIYPNVITQIELERLLSPIGPTYGHVHRISDCKTPKNVAMFQCVGSRNLKANIYCSGVCCMVAMKNAQLLKQEYPDMEITIFYIDIRATDKGNEEYYTAARKAGVNFIKSNISRVYEDPKTKNLKFLVQDSLRESLGIQEKEYDLIVLSTGINPSKGTKEAIAVLGLDKGPNGFLSEIHGCLAPQETNKRGIYICGCAAGPKNIPYSVSTALAAASKASALVLSGRIRQELMIPEVDQNLCMGCHRCEKSCFYHAIKVNEDGVAEVDELNCKGCGLCVTVCPANALDLKYYRNNQFRSEIYGICGNNYSMEDTV